MFSFILQNDEETKVTLHIDKVDKKSIRSYIFEAENELGKTQEIVPIHSRQGRSKYIQKLFIIRWGA